MEHRRTVLIHAEALRHRAMARLDAARREEHLEIAEALTWAVIQLCAAREPRGRGAGCVLRLKKQA